MFNFLKGGRKCQEENLKPKMARNLVREKEEKEEIPVPKPQQKEESQSNVEEKVTVITTDQLIVQQLNSILIQLEALKVNMNKGFEQVGVKFD